MPKSKHRKNHKQKLAARKKRLQDEKNRYMKMQREALMQMIEEEKKKGQFENNPDMPTFDPIINPDIDQDGPLLDGPTL